MIEGLKYKKLLMMGVGIQGPCNVFCDNNVVVLDSSVPESMLRNTRLSTIAERAKLSRLV